MLNYNNFRTRLLPLLAHNLGITVDQLHLGEMHKNNVTKESVTYSVDENLTMPVLYIQDVYKDYVSGEDMDSIVAKMVQIYKQPIVTKDTEKLQQFVENLSNWEYVKDKVTIRLLGTENNKEISNECPTHKLHDMMGVYYIFLEKSDLYSKEVKLTNKMFEIYGINESDLFNHALKNMDRICPPITNSIKQIIYNLQSGDISSKGQKINDQINNLDKDDSMFVLTNSSGIYGASTLLYPNILDKISEKLNCNLIILPSSVHEVLIVKDDGSTSIDNVKDIVRNINQTIVAKEEKLTDSVYQYDGVTKTFTINTEAKKEPRKNRISIISKEMLFEQEESEEIEK